MESIGNRSSILLTLKVTLNESTLIASTATSHQQPGKTYGVDCVSNLIQNYKQILCSLACCQVIHHLCDSWRAYPWNRTYFNVLCSVAHECLHTLLVAHPSSWTRNLRFQSSLFLHKLRWLMRVAEKLIYL